VGEEVLGDLVLCCEYTCAARRAKKPSRGSSWSCRPNFRETQSFAASSVSATVLQLLLCLLSTPFKMLKQQLLRQSRALSHSSIPRNVSRFSPFSRPLQSVPLRLSTAFPPRLQQRWQSTKPDPIPDSQSTPAAEAKPEAEEDLLKKEIEQKNREIIDLKVRSPLQANANLTLMMHS